MNAKRPRRRLEPLDHPAGDRVHIELLKAAYSEGRRALEQQESALNNIRQRSVQFMAFVGSATAFLVGSAVTVTPNRDHLFYFAVGLATAISIASLTFLLLILLGLARKPDILDNGAGSWKISNIRFLAIWKWGRAVWNFSVDPGVLVEDWIEPNISPSSESDFYRDMAMHSQRQLDENDFFLFQITRWYQLFIVSASLQVVAWVVTAWMFA